MSEQTTIPAAPAAEAPVTLAAPAAAPAAPVSTPAPVREPAKPDKGGFFLGTGRRKCSIARVRIKPGSGKITVNGRELDNFFHEIRDREDVVGPLKATSTFGRIDVAATVEGGGITGQAGAIRMGLARALTGYDPSLYGTLRDAGMMTRDARAVERKKYGQAGARRRFQFSKR